MSSGTQQHFVKSLVSFPHEPRVIESPFKSTPDITFSMVAASYTDLAMGPAVSCDIAKGTIPCLDTSPRVGLIPTNPVLRTGAWIEFCVSVPIPQIMSNPLSRLTPHALQY